MVGGGELGLDDHANPALSQWYNACSNGGTTAYCYGDQHDVSACPWPADADPDPSHVDALDVGSAAGCRGSIEPYTDVRDMSGSIFEWTAACGSSNGQTVCAIAGGVNQDPQMVRCDFLGTMAPSNSGAGLGIRCCKD